MTAPVSMDAGEVTEDFASMAAAAFSASGMAAFRDTNNCKRATAEAFKNEKFRQLFVNTNVYAGTEIMKNYSWKLSDFPSPSDLDPVILELKSIYNDGASSTCPKGDGVEARICALTGVWQMQLGTKEQIREVYAQRAKDWDDEKLTRVRHKDALWSWVYSRYFYRDWVDRMFRDGDGKANRLFQADNRETAMMELMVKSLQKDPNDMSVIDEFYTAYKCANKEKYELMVFNPSGLARVALGLSGYGPGFEEESI